MASAAITITNTVATIESDTSEAVMTKDTAMYGLAGVLVNGGSTTTWIKVNGTGVVTTNAQAQNLVSLPAGASMPVLKNFATMAHKSTGTTVLFWFPDGN